MEPYLLPVEPVTSIDGWLRLGGGKGLEAAQSLGADQTIDELNLSGLRGRGGGGFPTGRKWAGVRGQPGSHRYVVANGAEGEPATFKDRAILRANPYQVVEGVAIAALTIGAREAFIGVKASFQRERAALTRAVDEMQAAGLAGDVPIIVVAGPDEYLFGEEKALLEVIEGKPPLPRQLPPYIHGLFATSPQMGWESTPREYGSGEPGPSDSDQDESGVDHVDDSNPTLVNNVETLANVTHILARGPEWFRSMGTDLSPGHHVATVVGDVARPGVGEIDLGTPLSEVIETIGGGPLLGRTIKAVFSGVANAVITADKLGTPVSYEAMQAAGTGMGAAGYAVYDETACMVALACVFSQFLYVESCGQCPACKLGLGEISDRLNEIEGCRGTDRDIARIGGWLPTVTDGARCYLPVEEQLMLGSILRAFPEEFAAHIEGDCPTPRDLVVPKIVDLANGHVVYDERQRRKLPDWTYGG